MRGRRYERRKKDEKGEVVEDRGGKKNWGVGKGG